MTKNTIGGKRFKKGKKQTTLITRNFPKKSEYNSNSSSGEQFFYGQVVNVLGGKNVLVLDLENNKEIVGVICGNMYKKEWLKRDDVVLCSKRVDLSNSKCDIIFKYNNDEVKILKRTSELQYHDKIKNNLIDDIFHGNSDEEDESEQQVEVEQQPDYGNLEDFGDSDIDDI